MKKILFIMVLIFVATFNLNANGECGQQHGTCMATAEQVNKIQKENLSEKMNYWERFLKFFNLK